MDTELGFLIGADKAVEQKTNQIKFTNFVAQAKSRNILTPISGCKIKSFNLGISEKFHKHHMNLNAYTELYQYLIKKKIINQKLGKASFWTWDYIQTINPDLIKTDTLHELIKKEDINFPTLLKCYNINYNGTSVNSGTGGSLYTNAEICPNCPASVTNGTSTWSGTSTLTTPFTGYIYYTSLSPISGPTNPFTTTNSGPVGTYSSPATIVGNNASNQTIYVWPSGSMSQLSLYTPGCGAYTFYPTIGSPPILVFNQSGATTYSCGGSGSVTLQANGGTAPYNISWTDATGTITGNPTGNEISAIGGNLSVSG
jgi:hypothetical protein